MLPRFFDGNPLTWHRERPLGERGCDCDGGVRWLKGDGNARVRGRENAREHGLVRHVRVRDCDDGGVRDRSGNDRGCEHDHYY